MPFKQIPGFESYEIDESGTVRNKKGRIMKTRLNCYGYVRINLQQDKVKRTAYVHHLVLRAFYPEINPLGLTVDHIDRNKQNNHISNLRYMTDGENIKLAHLHNTDELLFYLSELRRKYSDNELIEIFKEMNSREGS